MTVTCYTVTVTGQTRPPVREDVPRQQYRNCLNYNQNLVMSPRGILTDSGSVGPSCRGAPPGLMTRFWL